jgi:mannitol/fructose-specific phosphotransferase system IIA component (Ntr-type)
MFHLSERVDAAHVALDLEATDVASCLRALVQHLVDNGEIDQVLGERLDEALLNREEIGGTCVGLGVAVPHAYFAEMPTQILLVGRLKTPIDYRAPDGKPVDLVFLLAGPLGAQAQHMRILARIARLLHDAIWLDELRGALTSADVIQAIRAVEERHV